MFITPQDSAAKVFDYIIIGTNFFYLVSQHFSLISCTGGGVCLNTPST